jgi:protein dithiol oxidoreductase (disulfide-forming)
MIRLRGLLFAVLGMLALLPVTAQAQLRWQQGRQYTLIQPAAAVSVPAGKIEVTEVFSYGCIHCFRAKDEVEKLKRALPADAVMTYVHASFIPSEGWPMLQQAFYTAQALGIAEATHQAVFSAIWETGELPLLDLKAGGTIRKPLPSIEAAARFYEKHSTVKAETFLAKARSREIDVAMQRADKLIQDLKVSGTPALVVNGRYQIHMEELNGWDDIRQLVLFLVGQERQRLKLPAPAGNLPAPAGPVTAPGG